MYRFIFALTTVGALTACDGGNPNASSQFTGVGTGAQPLILEPDLVEEPTTTVTSPDVYGSTLNSELTMNDVTYDAATDELLLNNMPFDGDAEGYDEYARNAAVSGAAFSKFGAFENVGGTSNYYAVFRRSDNGYSQVTAAASDRYLSFGFGGAAVQRLSGDGALPAANDIYVFQGEYAAVRNVIDPVSGNQVQYVAGTAIIEVDVEDFDTTGAVEGVIVDRVFFDNNGIQLTDLDRADFITLATAEINFDNWTIGSSTATVVPLTGGNYNATGSWQGLFAGPNGEEVAGIVVVSGTGPIGIDPSTGDFEEVQVREVGGFVATR